MAAEAAFGAVLQTFGNLLVEEAKFLAGVSDQVEDLKQNLAELQSFLREAEARKDEKRDIQVWISRSRDLAYEAEDWVEEYAFRTVSFFKRCYSRRSIGSDIKKLNSKISNLTESFQKYGITSSMSEREGSTSSSQQQLRRTYSHVVEDDFIKLDNDLEMLVEHLVKENDAVVSISGMGGLGKTTLARKVYNHDNVRGHFENQAWVCISQQWQQKDILQGILVKFFQSERKEIMKLRDEELIRKLSQTMRDKRCLVVLDDIWSSDPWESIKDAFPIKQNGSKLLLTTRNSDVVSHIDSNGFHLKPRFLSEQESWDLLRIKALRERAQIDDKVMQEMEQLGHEMVKQCGGLPLAVVVLGGILAQKKDITEWKIVHKNVKAHIGKGKTIVQRDGEIEKILALSYNDLPPKLKLCFLYLGIFPEDSKIDVEKLYQLWIAEGMISVNDQIRGESMLDVAEGYLGELAERSMVQVKVADDIVRMTRFEYCRLHDLMRDLCVKKATEDNCFTFVQSKNGFGDEAYKSTSSTDQIHRLVIHFEKEDIPKYVPPEKRITGHLRSLIFLVEGHYFGVPKTIKSQINPFPMLRVLELRGFFRKHYCVCVQFCFSIADNLSESLGNLIHLRYLSLSGSLFLSLPLSLGNLKQLQSLDLRGTIDLSLPKNFGKMRQLKYLYLPTFIGRKLRLDGLNNLEILDGFDRRYCSSEDLLKLTNLRWLKAEFHVKYDNMVTILNFISNTRSLLKASLVISFPSDDSLTPEKKSAVIKELFSCGKLIELKILHPFGNLPNYEAGFALNLISLSLNGSKMEDDPMETLERLPNLKYLYLIVDCFLGTEMQCRATKGFPQLRELWLTNLPNIQKWIIAEGAMPNLSFLRISNCNKLEMIPDGLRFITTLKALEVCGMPCEFNRRLQVIDGQEGEDFYKIQHVHVVKVS